MANKKKQQTQAQKDIKSRREGNKQDIRVAEKKKQQANTSSAKKSSGSSGSSSSSSSSRSSGSAGSSKKSGSSGVRISTSGAPSVTNYRADASSSVYNSNGTKKTTGSSASSSSVKKSSGSSGSAGSSKKSGTSGVKKTTSGTTSRSGTGGSSTRTGSSGTSHGGGTVASSGNYVRKLSDEQAKADVHSRRAGNMQDVRVAAKKEQQAQQAKADIRSRMEGNKHDIRVAEKKARHTLPEGVSADQLKKGLADYYAKDTSKQTFYSAVYDDKVGKIVERLNTTGYKNATELESLRTSYDSAKTALARLKLRGVDVTQAEQDLKQIDRELRNQKEYYSSFKNKAEYDAAQFINQHEGKTYTEIQKEIDVRSRRLGNEGQNKSARELTEQKAQLEWLKRNMYSYMNRQELLGELKKTYEERAQTAPSIRERIVSGDVSKQTGDRAEYDHKIERLQQAIRNSSDKTSLPESLWNKSELYQSSGGNQKLLYADEEYKNFASKLNLQRADDKALSKLTADSKVYAYWSSDGTRKTGRAKDLLDEYVARQNYQGAAAAAGTKVEKDFILNTNSIAHTLEEAGYNVKSMASAYERYKNENQAAEREAKIRNFAADHKVLASAASVASNLVGPLLAAAGTAGRITASQGFDSTRAAVDVNAPEFAAARFTTEARDEITKKLTENSGTFGKIVKSTLYGAGMSVADMAAAFAVAGGTPVYQAVMSSSAGVSELVDTIQSGGSVKQAIATGTAAAIFEALFEKVSFGNLADAMKANTLKQTVKKALASTLSEGSEEVFTDIANMVADAFINGDNSKFNRSVVENMKAGDNAAAAKSKAVTDTLIGLGESFAGGALAGGFTTFGLGLGATAVKRAGSKAAADTLTGKDAAANSAGAAQTIAGIKELAGETELTAKQQKKIDSDIRKAEKAQAKIESREQDGKKNAVTLKSAYDIGRAVNDVREASAESAVSSIRKNAIADRITELDKDGKLSPQDVDTLTAAVYEAYADEKNGKRTSRENISLITNNPVATTVRNELRSAESQRASQWIQDMRNTERAAREEIDERAESGVRSAEIQGVGEFKARTSNGEDVTVTAIENTRGGIRVRLSDGTNGVIRSGERSSESGDIIFDNEEDTKLFRAAARAGGAREANAFISAYQPGVDIDQYTREWDEAYAAGLLGNAATVDPSTASRSPSPWQGRLEAAYQAGVERRNSGRTDPLEIAHVLVKGARSDGVTVLSKGGLDALSDTDRQTLRLADAYGKEHGIRYIVTDTIGDSGANALYAGDNVVFVAADTGNADGGMSAAIGHDTWHYITETIRKSGDENANRYIKDRTAQLLDTLDSLSGYDFEARREQLRDLNERLGKNLTESELDEELVGNGMWDLITNDEAVRALAEADAKNGTNFLQRIRDAFEAVIQRIRESAARYGVAEARALVNAEEALARFNEVGNEAIRLADAARANSDQGSVVSDQNGVSEQKTANSEQEYEDEYDEEYDEEYEEEEDDDDDVDFEDSPIWAIERNRYGAWAIYGTEGVKQYYDMSKAEAKRRYIAEVKSIVSDAPDNYDEEDDGAGNRFMIREEVTADDGTTYKNVVLLDSDVLKKTNRHNRNTIFTKYVRKNFDGVKIPVYNEDGELEIISFAKKNERVLKDGASNERKVLDKLATKRRPVEMSVVLNAKEVLQTSKENGSSNDHSHQWLDQNGWKFRKAYVQTLSGKIYSVNLNIALARDGRNIFYDVNKTKEIGVGNVPNISRQGAGRSRPATTTDSEGSLSQPTGNVNTSGMKYMARENDYYLPEDEEETPYNGEKDFRLTERYREALTGMGFDRTDDQIVRMDPESEAGENRGNVPAYNKYPPRDEQTRRAMDRISKTSRPNPRDMEKVASSFDQADTNRMKADKEIAGILSALYRYASVGNEELSSDEYGQSLIDMAYMAAKAIVSVNSSYGAYTGGDPKGFYLDRFANDLLNDVLLINGNVIARGEFGMVPASELDSARREYESARKQDRKEIERLTRKNEETEKRFGEWAATEKKHDAQRRLDADKALREALRNNKKIERSRAGIKATSEKRRAELSATKKELDSETKRANRAERKAESAGRRADRAELEAQRRSENYREKSKQRTASFRQTLKEQENRLRHETGEAVYNAVQSERRQAVRERAAQKTLQNVTKLRKAVSNTRYEMPEAISSLTNTVLDMFDGNSLMMPENLQHTVASVMTAVQELALPEDGDIYRGLIDDITTATEAMTQMPQLYEMSAMAPGVYDETAGATNAEKYEDAVNTMVAATEHIVKRFNAQAKFMAKITQEVQKDIDTSKFGEKGKIRGALEQAGSMAGSFLRRAVMEEPYVARRIGGTFADLMDDFRRTGEKQYWDHVFAGQQKLNSLLDKYDARKYIDGKNKNPLKFTTHEGKALTLELTQAMGVYATWLRERANVDEKGKRRTAHLEAGGIMFTGGKMADGTRVPQSTGKFRLNDSDMQTIQEFLDKDGRKLTGLVKETVRYMTDTVGEWGNKASLKMYGVRKFTDMMYYPFETVENTFIARDKADVSGEMGDGKKRTQKFSNMGMSKDVTADAMNPVKVNNFFDVVAGHINSVAAYGAYAEGQQNLLWILNYRTAGTETEAGSVFSEYLDDAYGRGTAAWVNKWLSDLSGGQEKDNAFGAKLFRSFKGAAVAANLSVTLKQPTSIGRALAYLGPQYFLGNPFNAGGIRTDRNAYNEAMKYSGAAKSKLAGGSFDINDGRSAAEFMLQKSGKRINNLQDATGFGARIADEVTWGNIWNACKRWTRKNMPALTGEEFMQATAQKFDEVVQLTQVYDEQMIKSELMRSQNFLAKNATMFMSEPMKQLNMLSDAFYQVQKNPKSAEAWKYFARTNGALLVQALLTAAATGLVKVFRDRDEEKELPERFVAGVVDGAVDELNILSKIPFVKDLISMLQGYDVSRGDMELIADLINAIGDLADLLDPDSSTLAKLDARAKAYKYADVISRTAGTMTSFFGLPVNNVYRDVMGLVRSAPKLLTIGNETPERLEWALKEGLRDAFTVHLGDRFERSAFDFLIPTAGEIGESLLKGDTKKAEEQMTDLASYLSYTGDDKTTQTIRSKLYDIVKKYVEDGRIDDGTARDYVYKYLAHKAKSDGTQQTYTEDEAYWLVKKWHFLKENPDEQFREYNDLDQAIDRKADLTDAINELTAHGYTEAQADQRVYNHLKNRFDNGEIDSDEARDLLEYYAEYAHNKKTTGLMAQFETQKNLGELSEDEYNELLKLYGNDSDYLDPLHYARQKVEEWEQKKENGSYSLYSALDAAIQGGKSTADAVEHLEWLGVKESSIESAASKGVSIAVNKYYAEQIAKTGTSEAQRTAAAAKAGEYSAELYKKYVSDDENAAWAKGITTEYRFNNPGATGYISEYVRLDEAVRSGKNVGATVEEYIDHGKTIGGIFGHEYDQYKKAYADGDKAAMDAIRDTLLKLSDAYDYSGQKYIDAALARKRGEGG